MTRDPAVREQMTRHPVVREQVTRDKWLVTNAGASRTNESVARSPASQKLCGSPGAWAERPSRFSSSCSPWVARPSRREAAPVLLTYAAAAVRCYRYISSLVIYIGRAAADVTPVTFEAFGNKPFRYLKIKVLRGSRFCRKMHFRVFCPFFPHRFHFSYPAPLW